MTTEQPAETKEEKEQKEGEEKKEEVPQLKDVLAAYEGSPSQEQIDQWKVEHGEVFVSGFSDDDLYVWRPVTRQEWRELQARGQEPEAKFTQLDFEEMVCATCVLWKSSNTSFEQKGGTATTLHEQILQNSNFMAPQAASMFVARL